MAIPLDHDCECICEECTEAVIAEHQRLMTRRRKAIILEAARRVAAWPEWKRRQFEAFSKLESK